jgi:hypothetical protein
MADSLRMDPSEDHLPLSDLTLRNSRLLQLPNELLLQIIRDTEPDEFWSLAASCQHMWILSREFVFLRRQQQRSHRHYPYFRTPWEHHPDPLTRSNPSAPLLPDYTVIWDVHELLTRFQSAAKFVKSIALMKESPTPTSFMRLYRIATSPLIQKFVSESNILQQADLVGKILDGLEVSRTLLQPSDVLWGSGRLVLLMLCYNIQSLTIPRLGATHLLKLMSSVATSMYRERIPTLGGNLYGLWSNLKEIYIGPYSWKLPSQGRLLDLPEMRLRQRIERDIQIPIEVVLPLLYLPSLKKLCVWQLSPATTSQAFEEACNGTELLTSNIVSVEVFYGEVAQSQLEAFFRPMKKLRRLIWINKEGENRNGSHSSISLHGIKKALCNAQLTLESLCLALPGPVPIHSVEHGFSGLQAFTALKDLAIDVCLLFPGRGDVTSSVGARTAPIRFVEMMPSSLTTLSIFRSREHIKEFEWETFFASLPYAKSKGRFPAFAHLQFYGNYREPNNVDSGRSAFDWQSEYNSIRVFPAIGGIVERLIKAGIACTVHT